MLRSHVLVALALLLSKAAPAEKASPFPIPNYTVSRSWPLGGGAAWGNLALEASGARLFVSRGDHVDVVETVSGRLAGTIDHSSYWGRAWDRVRPGAEAGFHQQRPQQHRFSI